MSVPEDTLKHPDNSAPADAIAEREIKKHHATCITPEGTSAFIRDSVVYFWAWWAVQCAKLHNLKRDHWTVLVKRKFTSTTDAHTRLPVKRVSGCRFKGVDAMPQSAAEMQSSFITNAGIGAALPVLTGIVLVDFGTAS